MPMVSGTWSFNNQDLNVAGKYMTGVLSGYDLPPVRGKNILIPFAHGKTHVQKYFDERIIQFGMAILGTDLTDLQTNIDAMLGVLGKRSQSLLIHTMPDGSIRQAYAEVIDSIKLKYQNDQAALAVVEFLMAEPFFRATTTTNVSGTMSGGTISVNVNNPGSAPELNLIITLDGPLDNTVITNNTNGAVFNYWGVIAGGEQVVIDCGKFTAIMDGGINVIQYVAHSGAASLFALNAGVNAIEITDDDNANGTVKFTFYAPYL